MDQITGALTFLMSKEQDARKSMVDFKAPMPSKFLGVRDAVVVENWLGGLDQHFMFTNLPLDKRLNFALILLDDKAKVWWRRYPCNATVEVKDWNDLKKIIKDYFVPTGAYIAARGKLG